jgi:endonuclease/exonuclease/phosphatase (EEP) superfamily protein YafD
LTRSILIACTSVVLTALILTPELFGLGGILPFIVLAAFRPVVAAALLVLALFAVVVRRKYWPSTVAVCVLTAAMLGLMVAPRAIPETAPVPGPSLTLLSFNVHDGGADLATLARTINAARPDVVVLPEAGEHYRQLLVPKVEGVGYRSWTTGLPGAEDIHGIVVLVAPWLGAVTVRPLSTGAVARWMQISGGALGDIRIIAIHTAAPIPELTRDWASDIASLRQWCTPGHGSSILVGDFNATLDHSLLRSATVGCTDAAADRGRGLVATWPSLLPRWLGVQIDHILISGALRASTLRILDIPNSDHRALLARIMVLPTAARTRQS